MIEERKQRLEKLAAAGGDAEAEAKDMLMQIERAKDPATGQTVSDDRAFETLFTVLAAGTDTTATTMRALLAYVVSDARVYAKLSEEIDTAVIAGLPLPPRHEEAEKLEYFQACIKETLRLWPAVGMVRWLRGCTASIDPVCRFSPASHRVAARQLART